MEAQTLLVDGVQWYYGNDVAAAVGYRRPQKAIADLVPRRCKREKQQLMGNIVDHNQAIAVWIDEEGLRIFLSKSRLPRATQLATKMGIDINMRHTTHEEETIGAIECSFPGEVIRRQMPVESSTSTWYRVDLYFKEHNIVVECDENGHSGYDAEQEEDRKLAIREILQDPVVIRFNPDEPSFDIFKVIGQIYQAIRASLVTK